MTTEWKTIESAPRDGTTIILGRDGHVTVGRFHEDMGRFTVWLAASKLEHPTHWMPFPEPPHAQ